MVSKLMFPFYMDLTRPCLTCQHYCRHHSRFDTEIVVNRKIHEGEHVEYETGMKYCMKNKEFVYFNWNCGNHMVWKS
ncbi:MAG: hypothetical protein JNK43_04445 [Ignavibacteria bacterium]|nr:hypothetical protein [Ignavibacteria bacterium]